MASAQGVRAGRAFVEIGADPRKLFGALKGLEREFRRIGTSATAMGAKITAIGAGIGAPIGLAVRQFASFDDAIRATAAVSGASGDALQMLTDRARELGRTTSFTAVQVANLMTELGRAGFSPDQINEMTGAVLNLARATGTDATLAAGIMSATLRQFSLDASDAGRAADVLTKAANATFNTVEGLGESLKYAGPVAQSLGMSLEDTVAILGTLGNVGIQGSEAGTALRRLAVISAATGEQLQSLFGVSNVDAAGNLKPLVDILDEISKATATMPVAERTAKMAQAFGLLGITSANVLSQTAGGVRGLAADLRNASGTADQTARMMDAGLGGSFRIALSAIEGVGLALAEGLEPGLKSVTNVITGVSGGLTRLLKNNKELVATFGTGLAVFTASGAALMGVGLSLRFAAFSIGGLTSALQLLAAPFVAIGSLAVRAGTTVATFAATATAAAYRLLAAWTATAAGAGRSVVVFAAQATASLAAVAAQAARTAAVFAASFGGAIAKDLAGLAAPLLAPINAARAAVTTFATSSAASLQAYVAGVMNAARATVASATTIAGAWIASAYRAVQTFATAAAASVAAYVRSVAASVAATVRGAAAIAAGWLATAFPATTAFVTSAVAGLSTYIAATAASLVSTIAAATGIAAAWLAPIAPVLAIGAAIAGVGAGIVALAGGFQGVGQAAASALQPIAGWAGAAGASIGTAFGTVLSDARTVFSDLYSTAATTFGGISDALAMGDFAAAGEIAWLGLQAVWQRGVAAIMSYTDPFIEYLQNAFANFGTFSMNVWEAFLSNLQQGFRTGFAAIQGVIDNVVNGIIGTFDGLVTSIRVMWTRVQGLITGAQDTEQRVSQIQDEAALRAEQRQQERPGIAGRLEAAADDNSQDQAALQQRQDARITANAQAQQERSQRTQDRAADRQSRIDELNARLADKQAELAKRRAEPDAQVAAGGPAAAGGPLAAATGGGGLAVAAPAPSRSEVAGTFSAAAVGGLGLGSSVMDRIAKASEETAKNTAAFAQSEVVE